MTAQQIAEAIGARVIGNGATEVKCARSVESADDHSLTFAEDAKRFPAAMNSAAAVIVTGEFASSVGSSKTLIVAAQPRLAFTRAVALLHPEAKARPGVHPAAVVDPSAQLGREVSIDPYAVIERGAEIGAGTRISAHCFVGEGVEIGAECVLKPNVTVYAGTKIGDRVTVHAGAVLGSDGFGYVPDRSTGKYEKFPQVGTLIIGNDVEIGANTTVDRGALDATIIEDGVKLDNLVHIGHNVRLGKNVVIAAQTGLSGSIVVEDNVLIGGQVGIGDHVRIEEGVILGSGSGVLSNKVVSGKGIVFWGTPARPLREYLKQLAVLSRLAKK